MSTGRSAEATFVSNISSNVTLGSKVIKANTTFCGATKLVISLTTTMFVSAFAMNAILKMEADQLFDTHANMLSGQVKILYRGIEMSMYEWVGSHIHEQQRTKTTGGSWRYHWLHKQDPDYPDHPATQLPKQQHWHCSPNQAQINANYVTGINGVLPRRTPSNRILALKP